MDRSVFQEQFGLLGTSPAIRHVIDKITQVASTDITVLLEGESGVGKDVTARAIHGLSRRKSRNLVIVNCGAIPEGIIESELFGHEKGAFTGAHEAREGYFEKANGGTIFLDEIGDTPKNVQVKLLRVLESGEFFRVGSSKLSKTDVRVITATNRDMWKMVQEGTFREDLYYRLDTVKIKLPPLRERTEDILPLFRKFASEFAAKYDSVFKGFDDGATELLLSYRWPGNIRELRNVAEQLVVLERSQFIDKEKLQRYLKGRQHMGSTDHLPIVTVHSGPAGGRADSGRADGTSAGFGGAGFGASGFGGSGFGESGGGMGSGGYTSGGFGAGGFSSGGMGGHGGAAGLDPQLIYRALIEMKSELSDVKKLLANVIYSTMTQQQIKALPAGVHRAIDPNDISSHIVDAFLENQSPDGPFDGKRESHRPGAGPAARPGGGGLGMATGSGMTASAGSSGFAFRTPVQTQDGHVVHQESHDAQNASTGHSPADTLFNGQEIPSIEQAEKFLIEQALAKYGGNRRKAAEVLGISERTLYRKLDQYGLQ